LDYNASSIVLTRPFFFQY